MDDSVSFGPFRLTPSARVLEKHGAPLAIGNRALDILIVLVEHAGAIVNQRELLSRVWRGLVVCPGNLRVHMNALRRALDDPAGEARYIANVTGQGYCFVAPIERRAVPPLASMCGLPPVLKRMIGRDCAVHSIAARLIEARFVTVVGPGGMGKTTAAVAVAHSLLAEFAGTACFVDLGAVSDATLVVAAVASALGLRLPTEDALIERLRATRTLLVLDNCEHVIDAAASLAERLFNEAAQVHILATSREALRVEGEIAYLLPPLDSPSPDPSLTAEIALSYPAIRLFMERAFASGSRAPLKDAEAPVVANICHKLDGIALAIELAASQVGAHGIRGTWNLLQCRCGLDWPGRRTAPHRHQTLRALLDWSYRLLDEEEQAALCNLSAFDDSFTFEAASCRATCAMLDALIAKSLLSVLTDGSGSVCYRVLELTRTYILKKGLAPAPTSKASFEDFEQKPHLSVADGESRRNERCVARLARRV